MYRSHIRSQCLRVMTLACSVSGFALLVLAQASIAYARHAAPEVDPASATGALTLLAGGLLIIAGRMRRR